MAKLPRRIACATLSDPKPLADVTVRDMGAISMAVMSLPGSSSAADGEAGNEEGPPS
jgi:hypothetical protein